MALWRLKRRPLTLSRSSTSFGHVVLDQHFVDKLSSNDAIAFLLSPIVTNQFAFRPFFLRFRIAENLLTSSFGHAFFQAGQRSGSGLELVAFVGAVVAKSTYG